MPALSETHEAAVRACVALLEAFDPDRTVAECRALLQTALECAMDAIGQPRDERPDAGDLVDCFEIRKKGET